MAPFEHVVRLCSRVQIHYTACLSIVNGADWYQTEVVHSRVTLCFSCSPALSRRTSVRKRYKEAVPAVVSSSATYVPCSRTSSATLKLKLVTHPHTHYHSSAIMTSSFDHMLPPTERMPYTIITPQYSPHTTVAISLRHFEKESKQQAEQEYDNEHGLLPDSAADDELCVGIQERTIQKKKRKVRSAIVSRRKNAIYEKKLEEELHHRDQVNADLRNRLTLFHDVLGNIREKISALERSMHGKHRESQLAPGGALGAAVNHMGPQHVLRRARATAVTNNMSNSMLANAHHMLSQQEQAQAQAQAQPQAQPAQVHAPNMFFLQSEDRLVEDVLGHSHAKALTNLGEMDFSSECSDRQISPVIPTAAERCVASVGDVGALSAFGGEDAFGMEQRLGAAAMLAAPSFVV
eukprot:TRINITY_DN1131_c0_g3_i1.p1 TRINITY_DN1131_c0_g3~~TRINITY_DN1131_c0_g3_i1.p1  ORF type:complete len:406 (+),score=81.12 TRINITY_DN1131_c0_g3_i1:179-1396(+)